MVALLDYLDQTQPVRRMGMVEGDRDLDPFELAAAQARRRAPTRQPGAASLLASEGRTVPGDDPRQQAYNAYLGENYNPASLLQMAMGAVGAPGLVGGLPEGALGAGLGNLQKVMKIGREGPPGGGLYPGIYQRPDVIAAEAATRVAPEHPALKELFGVNRQDLYDISQQGKRAGNVDPMSLIRVPANARGSYVGEGVANSANAQRLIDAMSEAQTRAPELVKGMDAWYVMDPLYRRMVQLVGPEQAQRDYVRFNALGSMASPGSEVMTEINRGTAANMMAHQGQFPVFRQYGGTAEANRGADFPPQLRDVIGHPYHSTAQAGPMEKYLQGGAVDMTSPKVPLYIGASGVPETGFQTGLPVADAHFTRAIGASDVRAAAGHQHPGVSMKTPEYLSVGPWFRDAVAKPLGVEAVPGQARLWGLMSQYTGVDTPIGAPKLELLAQRIWERAKEKGYDPKVLRDYVLRGAGHAAIGGGVVGPGIALRPGED